MARCSYSTEYLLAQQAPVSIVKVKAYAGIHGNEEAWLLPLMGTLLCRRQALQTHVTAHIQLPRP